MSQQRIYLDSTSGQPWSVSAEMLAAATTLGWPLGSALHSEAARSRALQEASIATLAAKWSVPGSCIVPVHNLANAFGLAAESLAGTVAFSPLSRLGAIRAARVSCSTAAALEVDSAGYLQGAGSVRADWCVVQAGNHEVGSVDSLAELQSNLSSRLLVDASEWVGRAPGLPAGDVIIVRASSWAGPLSACFVVYRDGAPSLTAQKRQMLSPDPVLLAAAVNALERIGDVSQLATSHSKAVSTLAQRLRGMSGVEVHGDFSRPRLPHILSFSADHVDAETVARALDAKGFAVGAGSACIGENGEPSHVLNAMRVQSAGNIRVSLPLSANATDLESFADCVEEVIEELRASHVGN